MYRIYNKSTKGLFYLSEYSFDEDKKIHRCITDAGVKMEIVDKDFQDNFTLMKKIHENNHGAIYENDYYEFFQLVAVQGFAKIGCDSLEFVNMEKASKTARAIGSIYDVDMQGMNKRYGVGILCVS